MNNPTNHHIVTMSFDTDKEKKKDKSEKKMSPEIPKPLLARALFPKIRVFTIPRQYTRQNIFWGIFFHICFLPGRIWSVSNNDGEDIGSWYLYNSLY